LEQNRQDCVAPEASTPKDFNSSDFTDKDQIPQIPYPEVRS